MNTQSASFQAPVGGLLTSAPLANMPPESALVLDNFIAYSDKVSLRTGAQLFASGLSTGQVRTLAPYQVAGSSKFFAISDGGVFDITAGGTAGAAMFSVTGPVWSHIQFATSAVDLLVMVNGLDSMRQWYSGAWTTVATVGNSPVFNTNTFSLVTSYRQRLFFAVKNTLNFVFLPAGSISGNTAHLFQLNQLMHRGGYLVAMDTWSVDSGVGPDDYIVFISSEGEAVVYRGSDPLDATKWSLVGVYNIGPPLGQRCTAKISGDLWVLTKAGIVSLTRAMKSGRVSAKELVSYPFQPTYDEAVKTAVNPQDWQILSFLDQGLVIVNCSTVSTAGAQFVFQTGSGAWSRFTGWPARVFSTFGGELFYGTGTKVVKALSGTSDEGAWIEGKLLTSYNYLKNRSMQKQVSLLRPAFATSGIFQYELGLFEDFSKKGYSTLLAGQTSTAGIWDQSQWDNALWGGGDEVKQRWHHVSNRPAYCHALALRIRSRQASPALLALDYIYEPAGIF